jgi:peroxiredoxin
MLNFNQIFACSAVVLILACGSGNKTTAQAGTDKSPVTTMLKENNLQDQVVLIEFGTIGCEMSNQGLDAMADWQRRNAIPGLAFLRLEPTADKQTFDEYYAKKSLPFPVVRDIDMKIANALGTTIYPRFALIDKFGRVRYRGNQPTEKDLADWTRQLQDEKTDAGSKAPVFGSTTLDFSALLVNTKLPNLSGTTKSLTEYRGENGLLLTFVDTKCPFSAKASQEMPVVATALAKHNITTVLINISDQAAAVKKQYGAGITNATVVYDTSKQTQQCWNVQFVPLTVLLNKAGEVIYRGSPVWTDVAVSLAKQLNLPTGSINLEAQGTSQG